MRELLTARRRAEELAHALEGDSRHLDPSLDAPLRAAVLLREREPVSPATDFQLELRAALVAEVESAFEPVVAAAPRRQAHGRRRLTVAAAALVMVGAGTGVATAAQQSLPGDLLYPVKRSIESVQLHIARGNSGRGNEYLDEASTRLDEVEGLAAQDGSDDQSTSDISSTFQDFTDEATAGGQLLMAAYQIDGDTAALATVRKFTHSAAQQMTHLAADADLVPDVAGESFTSAAGTVGSLDAAAIIACKGDCNVSLPAVQVPDELLSIETFLPDTPDVEPGTAPSVPEPSPSSSPGLPEITLGPLPPSQGTGLPATSDPTVAPPTLDTTAPESGPPATGPITPQTGVPSSVPTSAPTSPLVPAPSTPSAPTATGSATTVAPPTDGPTAGITTIEPTEPTSAPLTTPPTAASPTVSPPTDSQPLFATPTPTAISIPSASTGQASSIPSASPPTPSTPSVTP